MWGLPGPGLKPVSPALAGGFLTTAPPENSLTLSSDRTEDTDTTIYPSVGMEQSWMHFTGWRGGEWGE